MTDDLSRLQILRAQAASGVLSVALDWIVETVDEAEAQLAAMRAALQDCADDLAERIEEDYRGTLHYPDYARSYERDMAPVRAARALLSTPPAEPQIESRYAGVTLRGDAARRFREQIGDVPPRVSVEPIASDDRLGLALEAVQFARKWLGDIVDPTTREAISESLDVVAYHIRSHRPSSLSNPEGQG